MSIREQVQTPDRAISLHSCLLWNKCLRPLPNNVTPDSLTPRFCAHWQPVQTIITSMKHSLVFFSGQGRVTGSPWKKPEKQDKKPGADRAHRKAEAANGTAVNKDERLKYGIKKGSGKSPEECCVCIYPSHTSKLIYFNSIILEVNKLINLDLYHQ